MNEDRGFSTGGHLAYFLTWTTYGTWLPGDDRGWSSKRDSAIQPPSPFMVEAARSRMKEAGFLLAEPHRRTVERTIREHCRIRNWPLHAISVRTNHVHVVVTSVGYRPDDVRDQFKAWCTRKLKAEVPGRTRFWTEGANCRWIFREAELRTVVEYVLEAQDRKGSEPDAPASESPTA